MDTHDLESLIPSPPRPQVPLPREVVDAIKDPQNQVGKYVRLGALGRGGMSQIWKAYDPQLSRYVALKFIRHDSSDPNDEARLHREALALAQLAHPNIVQIHDTGKHQGRLFLAVQFVDGKNPDALQCDLRRHLEIVRDVARALQHAHRAGFIHRDIKPGNIMVDHEGHVYVTDFDLARHARLPQVTEVDSILGTPAYMPPEQAEGRVDAVDARSDIYALGATLYHLATGVLPFTGAATLEIIQKVISEPLILPRTYVPMIPLAVEAIILKAMAKNPARRYPTAEDLADDLDRYLSGKPVAALRGMAVRRLVTWAESRIELLGLLAAFLLGGAVGFLLGRWL